MTAKEFKDKLDQLIFDYCEANGCAGVDVSIIPIFAETSIGNKLLKNRIEFEVKF